ncbi:MAG: VWA domain-containing protein [Ignavibacteria bacterium]|nr:VWA domain-containing protein [Ignavibacteria bacterium]
MRNKFTSLLVLLIIAAVVVTFSYTGCKKDETVTPAPPVTSITATGTIRGVTPDTATGTLIVTDQNGNPIQGLQSNNVVATLSWNNKGPDTISCQGVVTLVPNTGGGKNVASAITMDYSGSMYQSWIVLMKKAIKTYISKMQTNDISEIIKFDDQVVVVRPFTSDKNLLNRAVDSLDNYFGGATALYQSINQGINDAAMQSAQQYIRAVVAFTDGGENSSSVSKDSIVRNAKRNAIPIYTVGFFYDTTGQYAWYDLKSISDSTGAFAFWANTQDTTGAGLEDIYNKISGQLANSYTITIYWPCGTQIPSGVLVNVRTTVTYNNLVSTFNTTYIQP